MSRAAIRRKQILDRPQLCEPCTSFCRQWSLRGGGEVGKETRTDWADLPETECRKEDLDDAGLRWIKWHKQWKEWGWAVKGNPTGRGKRRPGRQGRVVERRRERKAKWWWNNNRKRKRHRQKRSAGRDNGETKLVQVRNKAKLQIIIVDPV